MENIGWTFRSDAEGGIRGTQVWDDIFAMDWRHPGNPIACWRHRSRKCAGVLVLHRVEARFIRGADVVDAVAQARLAALDCTLPIIVNPVLFFR